MPRRFHGNRRGEGECDTVDLGNLNPQDLMQHLQNVNWPANKDEIVSQVQNDNAPGGVIEQLKNNLSGGQYQGPEEVVSNIQGG
jgi:hypothetical protein